MTSVFRMATIDGIEAIEEVVAGTQLEPTQLAPGPLSGSMAQMIVGEKALSTAKISGSFRAFGPLSESNCTIGAIIESRGSNSQWSFETSFGDVAVVPPGVEHDARYGEYTHWIALGLPLECLIEQAELYELQLDEAFWNEPAMYRPSLQKRLSISTLLKSAVRNIEENPSIIAAPEAAEGFLHDILETVFLGYVEVGSSALKLRNNFVRATKVTNDVDRYLRSHADRPVRLPELCKHFGISERTLRRAFVDRYGIPPARYLLYRRLSQARQMLTKAHAEQIMVTDAAMKFGFWDFSRFARQYRDLFGETPSTTLKTNHVL